MALMMRWRALRLSTRTECRPGCGFKHCTHVWLELWTSFDLIWFAMASLSWSSLCIEAHWRLNSSSSAKAASPQNCVKQARLQRHFGRPSIVRMEDSSPRDWWRGMLACCCFFLFRGWAAAGGPCSSPLLLNSLTDAKAPSAMPTARHASWAWTWKAEAQSLPSHG